MRLELARKLPEDRGVHLREFPKYMISWSI
jgi:hypothetical protein